MLDPADGGVRTGVVVPADHHEVRAGRVDGQHVGWMVMHHVVPDGHGGVLVMPGLQRVGQVQFGFGRDAPGIDATTRGTGPVPRVDGHQAGVAQRGFFERVAQRGGGVARVADADDDLAVHGTRLFPHHDDRAAGLHGRVPADRAEQQRREPAQAAGADDEHQRARTALGDGYGWRPGQQARFDALPRRDFARSHDGLVEHEAGFALEPERNRLRLLRMVAHVRQQGGRGDDPQRRAVPPRLQGSPFHRAQRFR